MIKGLGVMLPPPENFAYVQSIYSLTQFLVSVRHIGFQPVSALSSLRLICCSTAYQLKAGIWGGACPPLNPSSVLLHFNSDISEPAK